MPVWWSTEPKDVITALSSSGGKGAELGEQPGALALVVVEFAVETGTRGPWTVLRVLGELDLSTAPAFRQQVVATVAEGHHDLVIDLDATDYIDSVGLGLILGALKRVRTQGGSVVVACGEERIRRVLELTELDRIVRVIRSVGDVDRLASASTSGRPAEATGE